jgi:hypothetical protein
MKWFRWLSNKFSFSFSFNFKDRPVDRSVEINRQAEEAREALENALKALRDLEEQEVEAKAISISLRDRREKNHFGELLIYAMRRRPPRRA